MIPAALGFDRDFNLVSIYGMPMRELGIPHRSITKVVRRIKIVPETGCWEWDLERGKIDGRGYVRVSISGAMIPIHRLMYNLLVGDIPDGLHAHHKCGVRHCCNPEHIHPVSAREHVLDFTPNSITNEHRRKTHCVHGHLLAGDNLRFDEATGKRHCRACKAEWARKTLATFREANPLPERTTCDNGHPWIPENWKMWRGKKQCRICHLEYLKGWRKRAKEKGHVVVNRKTHCKRGHELTPETIYKSKYGERNCILCRKEMNHERKVVQK